MNDTTPSTTGTELELEPATSAEAGTATASPVTADVESVAQAEAAYQSAQAAAEMTIPLSQVQGYVNSAIGLTIHKLRPTDEEIDALVTLIAEASEVQENSIAFAASVAREYIDRIGVDRAAVEMTSADLLQFDSQFEVRCDNRENPRTTRFTLLQRSAEDAHRIQAAMVSVSTNAGI